MPGVRTQSKLPIEIVAGNRLTSSHVCTQPQTHAFRSGFQPGTNVGAGCSCHPTGTNIIARLAFLYILSGQGQLHAFREQPLSGNSRWRLELGFPQFPHTRSSKVRGMNCKGPTPRNARQHFPNNQNRNGLSNVAGGGI